MRVAILFASVLLSLFHFSHSQPAPVIQRDPQATALLQAAVRAMGGTLPTDSVATGSFTIVAGSHTSNGTVRILTRGSNQTSEQITLPESTTAVIYSAPLASETNNSTTANLPLERAATSQSIIFPLPFLSAALANQDFSIHYVGAETLNQNSVQHVRLRNSFSSLRDLQQFADFAIFDIWLDANTTLPQRISFVRRDGGGMAPRIPVDAYFTSYESISGIAYPSQIKISFNGTPWATIAISSVTFNTGLTDSSFSVQ